MAQPNVSPGGGLRGARRRASRILLAALALFGATACASTDGESAPTPPTPVSAFMSAQDLAHSLGIVLERGGPSGRTSLVGADGSRILLFPGTSVASVAGTTLTLSEPAVESRDELWIRSQDAAQIRAAWMIRPHIASHGPSPVVAPPPPPPRTAGVTSRAPTPSTDENRATSAERAAWGVPVRRRWEYIVIHHSASAAGSAAEIDKWHRAQGWDGLGYDFVIGNGTGSRDGQVEVGYRWKRQLVGAHAKTDGNYMNEHGIGICLVGDFNGGRPSAAQMRSLERLCAFLVDHCRIAPQNIRLHGEVKSTECPGRNFPRNFALLLTESVGRTAGTR